MQSCMGAEPQELPLVQFQAIPEGPSGALATQGAREMGWFMDEFSKAAGFTPAIVTGKVVYRTLCWP